MHEVQKNIPIPRAMRPSAPARRKYPFETMDVGDMFFVPGKAKNTLATHVSTVGAQLGRKYGTRVLYMRETIEGWKPCEPDEDGAVIGVGVWRTE